jgi:succinoglycan biosynthesis transport protein ExoP
MAEAKPVHVPRERYPELVYPRPATAGPARTNEERGQDDIHLLDYWRVIVARRWTVIAVLFTTMAGTLVWSFNQTPIFEARAVIQIDRENPNILSFKDVYEVESSTDDTLRTQFEVLRSRSLARRVIENLHLDRVLEFQPKKPGLMASAAKTITGFLLPRSRSEADSDNLRPTVDEYLRRLSVSPVRQARIATVSFESQDPKLAAKIINAHANAFIEQNFLYRWEATQKASEFLKQQSETLKANLEKAEDRLQAYSRENQILFTDQGRNTAIEKLQQLEEEYTKAVADRILKESYDNLIRDGETDALPTITNNALLASLTNQLAQLQREESELAVTFSPDYPSRKRKLSQIEEITNLLDHERERVVRTVQAEYKAALDREQSFSRAVVQQREVVNKVNEGIIQYNILKRQVDSDKQLYEGLLTRLNEAGVSADLRASNIRIVDAAEVPEDPVRPKKLFNLSLSLMAGLVLGVGLAFFQDYIDDSIKTVEDITRYVRTPTLGIVPKMASLRAKKGYGYGQEFPQRTKSAETGLTIALPNIDLIAHEAPSSIMAEAYRSIRTSLLLSSPDHPPRSVLVTSAAPSEGKTVTAVNVAISLTQVGARVVLIDADMRKPRISSVFNLRDAVGLSSLLTGTAQLKEAIQPSSIPNLFVVPCGPLPPNPGELIVANCFKQLMHVLPQYFDYVILDSPPISNVSDARVLASICDATVLVVKALSTSRHHAIATANQLRESRARLVGTVLNDIDVSSVGGYYSYQYSNYMQPYSQDEKTIERS